MRRGSGHAPTVVLLALAAASRAAAFSTFAGSCKHAGVNHGLDKFAAQEGRGGHSLSLSAPGVNVPGATVTVTLSGEEEYKGLLLFAHVKGLPAGEWGDDLPEGVQPHPHCKQTVTHDTYHVGGKLSDAIPWVVPEGLAPGTEVVFKATVVRDYSTWYAFEHAFVVGSEEGAGGTPTLLRLETMAEDKAAAAPLQAEAKTPASVPDAGEGEATELAGEPAAAPAPEQEAESSSEEAEEEAAAAAKARQAAAKRKKAHGKVDMAALRARARVLRLLHAFCMVLAWLVAAPAGALASRYFKHLGPVWFDAHRVLQGVAVVATAMGAAIALGMLHPSLAELGPHGKLGLLVVVGAVAQPVSAVMRPGKTAGKPRALWKQAHTVVGWSMVAAGAANCVLGVRLMVELEGDSWARWGAGLLLAALCPLLGAAHVASTSRRNALPFSFASPAKARDA